MTQTKPLCFVLMPFGKKPDPTGRAAIDFDDIYARGIRPAIEEAGLVPLRVDQATVGGIIHRKMFEGLMLCEYAVADLTSANANVFYELGVRHAVRPCTTRAIFANHHTMPFDVTFLDALPYELGPQNELDASHADKLRNDLRDSLKALRDLTVRQTHVDSPIFQLLREWKAPDLAHLKTDVFRDQVEANEALKARMMEARSRGGDEGLVMLQAIEKEVGPFDLGQAGVIVDLMLSYRSLSAWKSMIELYDSMPATLQRQVLVREQLGFALNREAERVITKEGNLPWARVLRDRALAVLEKVEEEQGPSAETCGLIGRIHKDLWDRTRKTDPLQAAPHLRRALDAYRRGFQIDLRDAYPGINAVTLLDVKGDPSSIAERDALLPIVRFAVTEQLKRKKPDYWDYATMLELAVLGNDESQASEHLAEAVAVVREKWEPETTARNLGLIREARRQRGVEQPWLDTVIAELLARSK